MAHDPRARLAGRVALVTGAAQGLGARFSIALAEAGAAVAVCDLAPCDNTVAAIRTSDGKAIGITANVTDPAEMRAAVEECVAAFGKLDILVNNAALSGKLRLVAIDDIDSADWDSVMAVNVRGTFEATRAALPAMRSKGYGKVINIASGTAIKGAPRLLHYVASKGAVISMTRGMARELGGDGIRVNCIAPGLTMSDNTKVHPDWAGAIRAANIASRAIKRDAEPEDLLGAMIFLASPESDFMTGQTLAVDGGSVMV